ncbi:hypothetical protein NDU88_006610 [Pleurodeles waltl]|uniref:Uncharacterized protein n=1 Tax=Pleurodeles waltl TaxID=8319 RepID=A0AAV7X4K0_PLEWA|nr:hypothetical protein NDU88_006610 [Pleurodeles waltl]
MSVRRPSSSEAGDPLRPGIVIFTLHGVCGGLGPAGSFLGAAGEGSRQGRFSLRLPSPTHQREARKAHVTPVVASQFIQEGGTLKPPGLLRSQAVAVDQQDRNPVGFLVGPGPGIQW